MGRPKKIQTVNNQRLMTEAPSAESAAPQVLELEKCCGELREYKEKALAVIASDDSLQIIPFRSINKISTLSRSNPTSQINGILVKHRIEEVLEALEWDTKTVVSK